MPGVVEPWGGEVRVASMEPGALVELRVDEGRPVKKGDLLARLEDSAERHAVSIADADLRAAEAVFSGLPATPEEVRAAEAELRAATARAEQRRREKERAEALGHAGALPAEEVERAAASAEVDDATYGVAAARLALAKRGARRSERRIAEARVAGANARLAEAQAALARREVRAPIDGTLLWSRYHVGEFYEPTQGPLFVVGNV